MIAWAGIYILVTLNINERRHRNMIATRHHESPVIGRQMQSNSQPAEHILGPLLDHILLKSVSSNFCQT